MTMLESEKEIGAGAVVGIGNVFSSLILAGSWNRYGHSGSPLQERSWTHSKMR